MQRRLAVPALLAITLLVLSFFGGQRRMTLAASNADQIHLQFATAPIAQAGGDCDNDDDAGDPNESSECSPATARPFVSVENLVCSPNPATVGQTVGCNATVFSNVGLQTASISRGDGTVDVGLHTGGHAYRSCGTFTVTLAVIDTAGDVGQASTTVTVIGCAAPGGNQPAPQPQPGPQPAPQLFPCPDGHTQVQLGQSCPQPAQPTCTPPAVPTVYLDVHNGTNLQVHWTITTPTATAFNISVWDADQSQYIVSGAHAGASDTVWGVDVTVGHTYDAMVEAVNSCGVAYSQWAQLTVPACRFATRLPLRDTSNLVGYPYQVDSTNVTEDDVACQVTFKLSFTPNTSIPYVLRITSDSAVDNFLPSPDTFPIYWPNFPTQSLSITLSKDSSATFEASKLGFDDESSFYTGMVDTTFIVAKLLGVDPPPPNSFDETLSISANIANAIGQIPHAGGVGLGGAIANLIEDFRTNAGVLRVLQDTAALITSVPGASEAIVAVLAAAGITTVGGAAITATTVEAAVTVLNIALNAPGVASTLGEFFGAPNDQKVTYTNALQATP